MEISPPIDPGSAWVSFREVSRPHGMAVVNVGPEAEEMYDLPPCFLALGDGDGERLKETRSSTTNQGEMRLGILLCYDTWR